MNDDKQQHERRRLFTRRRHDDDDPSPGERPQPTRRHVVRSVVDLFASWIGLFRDVPIVSRLILWGLVALLAAAILRTLRGKR